MGKGKNGRDGRVFGRFLSALTAGVVLSSSSTSVPKNVFASETQSNSYSSSDSVVDNNSDLVHVENIGVKIDSEWVRLFKKDGYLTREQISRTEQIVVYLFDNCDYSFLNEFKNVKIFDICDNGAKSSLNFLDKSFFSDDYCSIGIASIYDSNENVSIASNGRTFDSSRFGFLKNIAKIDELDIFCDSYYSAGGDSTVTYNPARNICNYDWKFVSELKNVKNLTLSISSCNNFRYYDFSYLDSLFIFNWDYHYNSHYLHIPNDVIDRIKKDVPDFQFDEEIVEMNDKVNAILKDLNINNSMSDPDKLNIILAKVLSMCSSEKEKVYDTYLYSIWVDALCNSVGIDTYIVSSNNNFFNVVNINGHNYYIDASLLANEKVFVKEEKEFNGVKQPIYKKVPALSLLEKNDKDNIAKLEWYLMEPSSDAIGHDLNFIPFGLNLNFDSKSNEFTHPSYYDYAQSYINKLNNEVSNCDIVPIYLTDVPNSFNKSYKNNKYSAVRIYDNAVNEGLTLDENCFNDSPIIYYDANPHDVNCLEALGNERSFNEKRFGFLKKLPKIKLLNISTLTDVSNVDWDFVASLNIENLAVNISNNCNIDIKKFKNVKSLSISGAPYDVATYISSDDINYLKSNGVIVDYAELDKLNEINNELDQIYSRIIIDEHMSDKQKLDEILFYIFEKFTYDPMIRDAIKNNIEHSDKTALKYSGGIMYGALELNTQICGNYSSFLNAMCKRADIPCYMICATDHTWNGVELSGERYIIDSTSLDSSYYSDKSHFYTILEIFSDPNKKDIKESFKSYLSDPDDINNEHSNYLYIPYGFQNISNGDSVNFETSDDVMNGKSPLIKKKRK